MNRILKISSIVLFLIIGAVMVSSKTQAVFNNKLQSFTNEDTIDQSKGSIKNVYLNNCARCHGADGRGETELGRLYAAKDLTDKKVRKMSSKKMSRIIQNGYGSMPAFKKKLSSKDVSGLVGYIRTL